MQALGSSWKPLISVDPIFRSLGCKPPQKHGCHRNLSPFFSAREKLWEVFKQLRILNKYQDDKQYQEIFMGSRYFHGDFSVNQENSAFFFSFGQNFPTKLHGENPGISPPFSKNRGLPNKKSKKKTPAWWFKVTFLGWLSDPSKGLSDLQLGDEKGPLNYLAEGPTLRRAARRFCSFSSEFGSGAESSWYDSVGTEQVWVPTRQRSKVPLVFCRGIRWE